MTRIKDKILKDVLWKAELEEIRRIDSLPDVEYEPSEKYKRFLKELLEKTKEYEDGQKRIKKLKIFLVAALVSLLILAITACSFITPIRKFIIEVYEKYTQIVSSEETTTTIEQKYEITYIPSGYLLDAANIIDVAGMYEKRYKKGDCSIVYTMLAGSSITGIDSEDEPIKEKNIHGKTVYLFTKWKNDQAIWTDNDYKFTLSYPEELDFSEVEKMIRSVAPTGE